MAIKTNPYTRPNTLKSPLEVLYKKETNSVPLAPDLTDRGITSYSNDLYSQPVSQEVVGGSGTSSAADEYKNLLKQMQAQKKAAANAAYKTGKANLDAAKEEANRNSYIAYMQGIKNFPQMNAVTGNGGMAESIASKHRLNYENNRNAVEQQYLADLLNLQTNRDNNIVSAEQDYLTQLMSMSKPTTKSSGTKETQYRYKLGGNTYNEQELVAYLKSLGMTPEAIARYLDAKGLDL